MPKVKLPEYGRNLQELVEYCKTIPDRDKRTRYAYGIVSIMGDLYPDADKKPPLGSFWSNEQLRKSVVGGQSLERFVPANLSFFCTTKPVPGLYSTYPNTKVLPVHLE
ncbi:MAG: DUF4290 domain-containing protein, partial [Treponema sp.]|nr:DUF4290 domain-containing protein [Treponema sp.]